MSAIQLHWVWVVLAVVTGIPYAIAVSRYRVASFREPYNKDLSHMVVNRNTGKIYLAAVNHLYQMDPEFKREKEHETGPKLDNPMCPSYVGVANCESNPKLLDSFNKALVIDYSNDRLVICSSLYHGFCEKRSLIDVTILVGTEHVIPVVANNESASTVVFIAPGPSDNQTPRDVMYVGATWTNIGMEAARDMVPAFCSRTLENFKFAFKGVSTTTMMKIENQQRTLFPVHYIHGFSSEKFSYMVTIQRASTQSDNYISKLIRVCQNDKNYYSYAEVPLECHHKGALYNLAQAAYVGKAGFDLSKTLGIPTTEDVLYAVFAIGKPNSPNPTNASALCVYPMRNVKKKFTENIKECFDGTGNTGPDHIVITEPCMNTDLQIDDDYCGLHDINHPINGPHAVTSQAAVTLNTTASAILVSIPKPYTVAFIGTTTGHIKKVAIESQILASNFEDVTVEDGSPILSDMHFDLHDNFFYVMTKRWVYKLMVQNCTQYKTCADCLGARDPYCGWCSLENKCSLRDACSEHDAELRWLSYSGQTCTEITWVKPDQIQKQHQKITQLQLNISNLPSFSGQYQCAFFVYGVTPIVTQANRSGSSMITCETPMPFRLPPIPTGKDHLVMKLLVQMNNQDFVSTNFTFFDCSVHTSCTECTLSDFPCTWCISNHMCTHNATADCTGDELVVGRTVGASSPVGPMFCPRIERSQTEILVPSGTSLKVSVKGINLKVFQSPITCHFSLHNGKQVSARVTPSGSAYNIECRDVEFSYLENNAYKNVPFYIYWGDNNKRLDNPTKIQVTIYKCSAMANTCGGCLTMDTKYNCGWCEMPTSGCLIQNQCDKWLPSSEICPNPKIYDFMPKSGPTAGGTLLTITGQNLGKKYGDILGGVDVTDVSCNAVQDEYVAAKRIVCKTGRSGSTKHGRVRVTVQNMLVTLSDKNFDYVVPTLSGITPVRGPMAGGTRVTLTGEHMNTGTSRTVFIGGLPCKEILSMSMRELECHTSQSPNMGRYTVEVKFDDETVNSNVEYEYVQNPTVDDIHPKKAIRHGGIEITVTGQHFESIQEPKMMLQKQKGGTQFKGACTTKNDTVMFCHSPEVDLTKVDLAKGDTQDLLNFYYGLLLDNVTGLRNLSTNPVFGRFTVYPDPVFETFSEPIRAFQDKNDAYLTINGQNLNLGISEADVEVKVGEGRCIVTSLQKQLTCQPPKTQPKSLNGGKHPEIFVEIGRNMSIFIGYLSYEQTEILPLAAVIGIAVSGGLLVIIVISVVIAYRIKSAENDNMMKRMQIQMDNLEAKVAKECKEAFAELQTDMTELNSNLYGQVAIPFWDYRTYCMRVLFPQEGDQDHPVTKDLEVDYSQRENVERGLKLFSQLLGNKTFLLIFIRTLEANKQFSMRDRVNVASLISVALQTKMEYATDILKTLLAELIEKSVEGRNHPKLLLRRTESVAEKMLTNWFTFLLYKFLRECAGEPLFMLYQAIKQQVAKGPVDSVTSEARYSLSEDKLIRQQIDFRQLTIYIQDLDQYGAQSHPVRVLDCDTITQAKEKILDAIYKNAPFSSRPGKDDVDLEWHSGIKGRLVLQNEDATSKMDGEYKRLNSLNHYKVPDMAYMALVPKQAPSIYNISLTSSEKSSGSKLYENMTLYTRSPSLNRTANPQGVHIDIENGSINNNRSYHLVKQHDSETHKEGDRGSKMVSEIYLTRLLATKGTLQQFVDDLFERIFSTAHRGTVLPLATKYMFDFLDDQALLHNIQDPEVVHTWKSNSLPLRFWVNVIKNPNFVFDIYKSNIVDSCLSVVAQTFMDSCSMSEHRLGKDSPSSKLLYAKDIPKYKKWVERYYQDIKMMPAISDQDFTAVLTEEARLHQDEFNINAALLELYKYVERYSMELTEALEEDEFARKNRLNTRLDQVQMAMGHSREAYC